MRSLSAELQLFRDSIPKPEDCKDDPCMFAPARNPHRPYQWPDGKYCNGYGDVYGTNADGDVAVLCGGCPCWRKAKRIDMVAEYSSQMTLDYKCKVREARLDEHALGQVRAAFSFQTRGTIFSGPVGTGKTIAGHWLIQRMIERYRMPGLYVSCRRIGEDCALLATETDQRWGAERRLANMLHGCRTNSIVFLDDLGRERLSDAVCEKICQAVDALYERSAPAVFSTNFSSDQIKARYGDDIYDRLFDKRWTTAIRITGTSARLEPSPEPKQQDWSELMAPKQEEVFA